MLLLGLIVISVGFSESMSMVNDSKLQTFLLADALQLFNLRKGGGGGVILDFGLCKLISRENINVYYALGVQNLHNLIILLGAVKSTSV